MSHVRRFDHIGITVADLDTVTASFVGLGLDGLDVQGARMPVEGELLDTVIGIPDSRTEPGRPGAMSNELGLRNDAGRRLVGPLHRAQFACLLALGAPPDCVRAPSVADLARNSGGADGPTVAPTAAGGSVQIEY